jgi:hypothetical protein
MSTLSFKFKCGRQTAVLTFLPPGRDGVIRGSCAWSGDGPHKLGPEALAVYKRERLAALAAVKAQAGLPPGENRRVDVTHVFTSSAAGPKMIT